jgi:hypothetical protein
MKTWPPSLLNPSTRIFSVSSSAAAVVSIAASATTVIAVKATIWRGEVRAAKFHGMVFPLWTAPMIPDQSGPL